MIHISEKVAAIKDPAKKQRAQKALFQGQCNCAYWHGLFGGLYLNYLRDALTRNLLEAENIADEANLGAGILEAETWDFESRNSTDMLLANDHFNAVVSPIHGGALSMVDLRKFNHAITNVMARRPEAYHEAVRNLPQQGQGDDEVVSIHDIVAAKEDGLADYLIFDPADRLCFQDHFLPFDVNIERFRRISHLPYNDFIDSAYNLHTAVVDKDKASVTCDRTGYVWIDEEHRQLTIEKTYSLKRNRPKLEVAYTFTAGDKPIHVNWACESNLTLLTKDAKDRILTVGDEKRLLDTIEAFDSGSKFALTDGWQGFTLEVTMDHKAGLWTFPIETVNQSEGGYERTYQGSSFTQVVGLNLEPGQSTTIHIAWEIITEENA
jgi:alpha-amylase